MGGAPMRVRWVAVVVVLGLAGSACGARFKGHEESSVRAGGQGGEPATSAAATPGETGGGTAATEPAATGPGPAPGVTDTEIKIGYLLPITGAAPIPVHFERGVNVYWNDVNNKGGFGGRKVRVI